MTLFFHYEGKDGRSPEVLATLKAKSKRRALRHFAGKEVRHRVTCKDATSIEFAFFRRSGSPVRIRWRKSTAVKATIPLIMCGNKRVEAVTKPKLKARDVPTGKTPGKD